MGSFEDMLKGKASGPTAAPINSPFKPAPVTPPMPAPAPATYAPPAVSAPSAPVTRASWPASRQMATGREQCQPVLQTESNSVWSRIELALARMHSAMVDACMALGIEAYVRRSNAFETPFTVTFECWIQAPKDCYLTERIFASIEVQPKPWHSYEMEYAVRIGDRGRMKVLGRFGDVRDQDIHALLSHLVRGTARPSFYPRLLQPGDPFWRWFTSVKNKPTSLRRDWLAIARRILILGALGGIPIEIGSPLGFLGAALFFGGAIWAYYSAKQPIAVRNAGRPMWQPRTLRVYDWWQAVLFGAAKSADTLRARFASVLQAPPVEGFAATTERIGYRTLDQLTVRDQIVLTAKRGVIYCQIYEFGADLYVGWESFLNQGRWVEEVGQRGRDVATGRRVEVRAVIPGVEALSEYDYADANCLTEWTHAQMVRLTKQLMKELQIDQEIDFKIVRGERTGTDQAAASSSGTPHGTPQRSRLMGLFRRTG